MKKKSLKPKRQTYGKGKIHKKQVGKILVSSAVASTLVFQPFVPAIENGQIVGFIQDSVKAATLAEVGILTDETLTATNAPNPYNLTLTLNGTGLANVELANPQTVAVFYAPDLAGSLNAETAQVRVTDLPITLDDLPALDNLLDPVLGTVQGLASDLLGLLEPLESLGLVGGVSELRGALDALQNVDIALANTLEYNRTVPVTVNQEEGTITVDFTEDIRNYLNGTINDVVLQLLTDLADAVENLNVGPLNVGGLVSGILNTVTPVIDAITNEPLNLLGDLASVQVLGETTVTVNVTVDENTEAAGDIPISGVVVGTSVIDGTLLSTLTPADTVTIPASEDTTALEAPIVNLVDSEATDVTGTAEPNSEITVTLPNDEPATGITDEDGNFVVTLPEGTDLAAGDELTVIAIDEAGNESDPTTVTVTEATTPDAVAPVITPIANTSALENKFINPIAVEVNETSEIATEGLPNGLAYDSEANGITGTPVVDDWEAAEEERDFAVSVTAADNTGNVGTEDFVLTIERDTDRDGDPDLTDSDDDNDGATDDEENEAGTDPKDETDTPPLSDTEAPVITPISDVEATENAAIDDIVIEVNEPSEVLLTFLPEGLTFDEDTDTISGTPTINDWGETEEERTFETVVTALDAAGNEGTETFLFTVLRDTDGDGTPDVEDTDEDNDGAADEEELEAGTNPKDNSDTPTGETPAEDTEAPVITPIPDISAEENQPIENVVVEVNEPSKVIVEDLPSGITYDPETGVISGTPVIEDWAADETERTFDVTITAEDEAGNISTIDVTIAVSRDLDGEGTAGVSDSNNDTDGSVNDGNNTAGDGQDSGTSDTNGEETLPQTGEAQNVWKALSGSVMAAVGAFMLAWNKKKKAFTKKK